MNSYKLCITFLIWLAMEAIFFILLTGCFDLVVHRYTQSACIIIVSCVHHMRLHDSSRIYNLRVRTASNNSLKVFCFLMYNLIFI